ncbi:hypothetical protein H0I23_16460 [Cellulophaga sp. HaHaR_3_176]|uniref:hypothetical protein n=1 Tax=Cellulophaga sp. HaHaR_3_176 TaxID=1942464 RepID=UPI001C1F9294|nr:hypothetical protein [Cellulophaga sp. HaHaR_3_176]QWX84017.1 hypothetical protein H0I23_16460 [Cellulophaga sp. HaHaR_3_176]
MKKYIAYSILFFTANICFGQLLPGTLYGTAGPTYSQSLSDVVKEAGEDDGSIAYENGASAVQISFYLDPSNLRSSSQNCANNVYKYKVFMHTQNAPEGLVLEARTFSNAGNRFPASANYDLFPANGPRDLYPENGGSYIAIPNEDSAAIKVFEFTGCRTNIPIQFRVAASALSDSGTSNTEVYYTVVGSLN